MSSFKCKKCGYEQDAVRGMPPPSCKQCDATGAIWTKVAVGGKSPAKPVAKKPPVGKPLSPATGATPSAKPPNKTSGMPTPKSLGGMPAPAKTGAAVPKKKATEPPKSPSAPAAKSAIPPPKSAPPPMKRFKGAAPPAMPAATTAPAPAAKPTPPPVATPPPIQRAAPPPATQPGPVVESTVPPAPVESAVASVATPTGPARSVKHKAPVPDRLVQGITERVVWVYPEDVASDAEPQRNCPARDGAGRTYFAIANKVVAFDDQGGDLKKVWSYETGGRILGSPVVGPDENIRIHSEDAHLHVLSREGARVGTPVQVGEPLGWATPLVDAANTTWLCGYHGGLFKVDTNGATESEVYFRGKQRFDCTGLIHDGVLYVGAENACVYAIPLGDGRGKNVWDHLNEEGRTGWFINSALALASGPTLVVASRDDLLYGFQLDGKKAWSLEVNGQMLSSPIVDADDSIYVGLSVIEGRDKPRGALIRIDGMSHRVRWRYETDAPVESTAVVGDDGTVYFGDNDGFIHAVNGDGKQVWTERVAAGVRSPGAMVQSGRVVFGLENGQFVALSCESKSLRPRAWAKFMGNTMQSGALTE